MNNVVYTGGTFDLFHKGHVNFLKRCSRFGPVVVSLNTDEFLREYKGKPAVMNYEERKAVLEACKFVHHVVPNTGGADSKPAILSEQPDYIIIGSDWAKKDYYKQMSFTQDWLDEHGFVLMYLPYTDGISTTNIRKRLNGK